MLGVTAGFWLEVEVPAEAVLGSLSSALRFTGDGSEARGQRDSSRVHVALTLKSRQSREQRQRQQGQRTHLAVAGLIGGIPHFVATLFACSSRADPRTATFPSTQHPLHSRLDSIMSTAKKPAAKPTGKKSAAGDRWDAGLVAAVVNDVREP